MSHWGNRPDGRDSGSDGAEETPEGRPQPEPPRTVRCVIDGEFGEGGRGDCGRREPAARAATAATDSARLRNHLEWKRQKEAEYARRREAERLEEERRAEEKARLEKEKRRREKEREEKMREWQEQKAREKEERRREEMVLKALEQEIKGVTQTLDKERLIHEWIRLKNKQKQLEAEKKAELLKKEEETRALRQSLAEISYRQWKERTKSRRISLPKNGYQIFGPKPVPVVKEDWNHDFIKGDDPPERGASARTPTSTVSMTSIRGGPRKAGSRCQVQASRSRSSVGNELPFAELRIPDAEQRWRGCDPARRQPDRAGGRPPNLREETFHVQVPRGTAKPLSIPGVEVLPTKNKLDIYLQPGREEASPRRERPKPGRQPEDGLRRYLQGLGEVNTKLLIDLSEKLSDGRIAGAASKAAADGDRPEQQPQQPGRRSRSYDKPSRRQTPGRSSSAATSEGSKKPEKPAGEGKKQKKPGGEKKAKKPPPLPADSPYCARRTRTRKKTRKEDADE